MDSLLLTFGLVFIAGLLASATPCVYPMLPITAAIFAARGEGSWRRSRLHAVIYFLGIICFYMLVGLLAATTGTALSAIMTNAWVHLGFAGLFAYLGLSMLGLYELQLFSSFMAKLDMFVNRVGGFSGTFCMGATTGLIVSPCVGPITGAILLDITGQVARANTIVGSATYDTLLRGVILMTSFGLGLGIPFLLIGLLSSRLPSAGTLANKNKIYPRASYSLLCLHVLHKGHRDRRSSSQRSSYYPYRDNSSGRCALSWYLLSFSEHACETR